MISSEVERTLVKSPPELWTELSNPDALARHLGELGDIRITRVEPEHAVEWEAETMAGTVRIKPSGWGTKVTLTATREIAAPEAPVDAEPVPEIASQPASDPVLELTMGLDSEPTAKPARDAAGEVALEPAPAPAPADPHLQAEPSPGFFSRLFGGRRRRRAAQEPDPFAAVREALSLETMTAADPFSMPRAVEAGSPKEDKIETPPDRTADVSADLKAAEEAAAEEVTAVLTTVLDRLGAAHHRPFSRA